MTFAFTAEQDQFGASVSDMFTSLGSPGEVRRLLDDDRGWDPAVWRRMAAEVGIPGLLLPEEVGGSGASFVEMGIVFEAAGHALFPAPLLATSVMAAATLLLASGTRDAARWLRGLSEGDLVATLAVAEDAGTWNVEAIGCRASLRSGGWTLDGCKSFVLEAAAADLIFIAARTPDGVALFGVEGSPAGFTRTRLEMLDPTRRLGRLELDAVEATLLAGPNRAASIIATVVDLARIALACEQVGVAARCLEMSVDYARDRHQFGRPIGSFQAVKHQLANVLLAVESARSAARFAASVAGDVAGCLTRSGSDELPRAAAVAGSAASHAATLAAQQNIQTLGGIGYTWEHDAHLYLKRARASAALLGTIDQHHERLAELGGAGR